MSDENGALSTTLNVIEQRFI